LAVNVVYGIHNYTESRKIIKDVEKGQRKTEELLKRTESALAEMRETNRAA
jgi:hypothetical protein